MQHGVQNEELDNTLISRLCSALDEVCTFNTALLLKRGTKDRITRFHASADPNLSVSNYVARMRRYGGASPSCYIAAVVLMDRIAKSVDPQFLLSYFNVHRLLVTAVLLATKFNDDIYYSNRHWSKVAGVTLRELNILEAEALRLLDWRCMVSVEEFQQTAQSLLDAAAGVAASSSNGVGGVGGGGGGGEGAATTSTTIVVIVQEASEVRACAGMGKRDHQDEISNHSSPTVSSSSPMGVGVMIDDDENGDDDSDGDCEINFSEIAVRQGAVSEGRRKSFTSIDSTTSASNDTVMRRNH